MSDLAQDVDMINIQPEFLGIPYEKFAAGSQLPDGDPWAQQMSDVAKSARQTGKKLLVQIALVRINLIGNAAYTDGPVQVQASWAPACADLTRPEYAHVAQAYTNYALWIARTFTPEYYVIMLEPNLYYSSCGGNTPTWRYLVKLERDVYRAVKAEFPSMLLFPSFNLEAIYGVNPLAVPDPGGFDQAHYLALLAMKRDRLGLVSFPQVMGNPYKIPLDYLTRILDRNPNEPPVVLTEIGWNTTSVTYYDQVNRNCVMSYSEPSYVSAFLKFVLYSGYAGNFDVITWWSSRDEMPAGVVDTCFPTATPPEFAECADNIWCVAVSVARAYPPPGSVPALAELSLKAFGAMGLRSYDGTAKDDVLGVWQQFLNLPIDSSAVTSRLRTAREGYAVESK